MKSYPFAKWKSRWAPTKGTWTYVIRDGVRIVLLCCPECESVGDLTDHGVAVDGTVNPSVDCHRCPFHENIKLDDWQENQ
jgi:hypothetical protein